MSWYRQLKNYFCFYSRDQSETFLRCLKTQFEPCIGPSSNPILLETLGLVVLQTIQGTHLLCESSVKRIIWDNLPPLLRTVASCENDYTAEAADCGRTFRSKFIPVPSPLCEEFENAKTCIDNAREEYCSFGIHARKTLMGNFNPFCDNRTRPLFADAGSCLRMEYKLEFATFIILLINTFTWKVCVMDLGRDLTYSFLTHAQMDENSSPYTPPP